MDTHINAKPTPAAVRYLTSTVVKATTSQSHHILKHVQDTQVRFTCSEQVQTDLKPGILFVERDYLIPARRESIKHSFLYFSPGLCAPSNVTVSLGCEYATVSWSQVTGFEMIIATATASDGRNHTCSSNFSNSCNFTDLHCGETYSIAVVTVDMGYWTEPSSAVELKTGKLLHFNKPSVKELFFKKRFLLYYPSFVSSN